MPDETLPARGDEAPAAAEPVPAEDPSAEDVAGTLEALRDLVASNSSARSLYVAALKAARTRRERSDVAAGLEGVARPKTCTQTPQNVLAALIRRGGLRETVLVDGKPYPGTLDDLRADESVGDDAEVSYAVESTEAGRLLLDEIKPSSRIERLFAAKPDFADTFLEVLAFCDAEGGKTRDEIAALLKEDGDALRISPATGLPTVYPAFFTGELEDAGALVWDGTWRLTEEGEAFLEGVH